MICYYASCRGRSGLSLEDTTSRRAAPPSRPAAGKGTIKPALIDRDVRDPARIRETGELAQRTKTRRM